jgi:hypothetical protein
MLVFNNYFCKNRKSKLHFGDRVAVLNVFLYQTGGSTVRLLWNVVVDWSHTHTSCTYLTCTNASGVSKGVSSDQLVTWHAILVYLSSSNWILRIQFKFMHVIKLLVDPMTREAKTNGSCIPIGSWSYQSSSWTENSFFKKIEIYTLHPFKYPS